MPTESVAHIDHRAQAIAQRSDKAVRNGQARREIEMSPESGGLVPRAANGSGDIHAVANPRVAAQGKGPRFIELCANNGDGGDDRARGPTTVAILRARDDLQRRTPTLRRFAKPRLESRLESRKAISVEPARNHDARNRRQRNRISHRRNIAQIAQHRLLADEIRITAMRSVTAFDGGVAGDERSARSWSLSFAGALGQRHHRCTNHGWLR